MYDFRSIALATALGLGAGALLGALPMNSTAGAATLSAMADEDKTETGKIKSVDASNNRFVITVGDRDVTIRVDDKTKYTLDGKESTMGAALKVNGTAKVKHKDFLAHKVDVTSPATP